MKYYLQEIVNKMVKYVASLHSSHQISFKHMIAKTSIMEFKQNLKAVLNTSP